MGSETLPSTCYILSEESSIPFTLRVRDIKKSVLKKSILKVEVSEDFVVDLDLHLLIATIPIAHAMTP